MTLNQLYYFKTVAEFENYHKAAEELFISQPSLSRSIAALEKELGVTLFEKSGRGISLTKVGRIFQEYADRILSECEIASSKMQELSGDSGRIDIGYVFPLAGHYMPHTVRTFLDIEENKNVVFNFYQNHTPAIAKKVKSGELDIGFGGYIENDEAFDHFPVLSQEMVIITPKGHELEGQESISIQELGHFPVIGYDKGSWLGKYTDNLYRRLNMHPNVIIHCPDEHSIMALVIENFGIAIVPRVDSLDESKINVHQIGDITLRHQTFMFWIRDRYRLPATERFIEFMKSRSTFPAAEQISDHFM